MAHSGSLSECMANNEPIPALNAALTADQLRRRYITALSLIALLTIASQIVMQYLISDQAYDSRVVNSAGRQLAKTNPASCRAWTKSFSATTRKPRTR